MRRFTVMVLMAAVLFSTWALYASPGLDPHGSPPTGVLRVTDAPRGDCTQCHPVHQDEWTLDAFPEILFAENDNRIAFWDQGAETCHPDRPQNYPLDEFDRMPESDLEAGYFEANAGGIRRIGVEFRGRWPGESIYTDPTITATGHFVSPHAHDPDMPRRSDIGEGLCHNCHNAHGTPNAFDLLIAPYGGIGGHDAVGAPNEYELCFSCHGIDGPAGMDPENRFIEDYYDAGLNGDHAGHQIRMNEKVAISWPAHIREGDMLPCYDCHNPHGSAGNNYVEPNAFAISDQRPEWSGLTDTTNDPEQARRFCFGCHIPADGIPGTKTVEGIVMNTISNRNSHRSTSAHPCFDCHGRSYAGPTSNNVHNTSPNPVPKREIDEW